MKSIVLPAEDGYPLAANVFAPEAAARASVLLPGAMGVRQDFYFPFAVWLSQQGFRAGRRLRMVGDVPKAAILEWWRWCLDEDYLVGALGEGARRGFTRIACRMLSLSFADDEMMSETNIRKLHACYVGAPLEMRRFGPQDFGVRRIGHFGFFRESFRATLWPQVGDWLAGALPGVR